MEILEQLVLMGPNRRGERTVIELCMEASEEECRLLGSAVGKIRKQVLRTLSESGIETPEGHPLRDTLPAAAIEACAHLIGAIPLLLQQSAGHRVGFLAVYPSHLPNRCRVAYEYEQSDAGIDAGRLAVHLINEVEPELRLSEMPIEDYGGFDAEISAYFEQAADHILPRDAEAIIEAARRADIPCAKLERDPYQGLEGEFRVRPNGLLKLGHACHQRVVDGTFPIDSDAGLAAMVHDRWAVRGALESLGLPLPRRDVASGIQLSARRAVRAAERIGYPVVVKRRRIARPCRNSQVALALQDADAVRSAAEQFLRASPGVLLEGHIQGRVFKIIVVDSAVVGVVEVEGGRAVADVTGQAHPDLLDLAVEVCRRLRPAAMTLTLVCADIRRSLQRGDAIVGLDPAPALDLLLPESAPFPAQDMLDRAAAGLVRRLFPEGTPSRIPLVSVTGTAGKTTTCTLIERIMHSAGYETARAGTTGLFRNGEWLEFGDMSGGLGHHRVLESPDVQLAVLETARGAATGVGLAFDACEVSVCTNVGAEHLGHRGIETVPEMAELKEFIVQRARGAAVLNADNAYSAGMLPGLDGPQPWLVSVERTAAHLLEEHGEKVNYCVAEREGDAEWINLYAAGRKVPVMPVRDIPITSGGQVRYNVSNVLQAVAACYHLGASEDDMRRALATFTPTFEDNPGRLNFYREMPFTVLMDSAHTGEGLEYLMEFVEALEVQARKVILYSISGSMRTEEIGERAGIAAGHFDLYFCRNYPKLHGRPPHEVPALMQQALVARGVPPSSIIEVPEGNAVETALRACRPGDLLVVCCSVLGLRDEWATITSFGRGDTGHPED